MDQRWLRGRCVRRNGTPLHPAAVTDLFDKLVEESGVPPIRLHDLRHGATAEGIARLVPHKAASVRIMPDRPAIEDHPRFGLANHDPQRRNGE